jgi:hypothetical protein
MQSVTSDRAATHGARCDRYKHLGDLMTMRNFDNCKETARRFYPQCSFEGSTGPERTIFNSGDHVGHCWPASPDWNGKWFMRLNGVTQ